MHPRLYRPRQVVVLRLHRETIASRMAAAFVSLRDEPSRPRETFLRLRAEEARHAIRHPGRRHR
ncbi:hypothetical protein [Microvirga calopogonii]|uniref:hypothetical protein n=1 Tax=Microvirga calopogonii TaxID=2078013 RepID=UPI000E0CC787|nr:hypothetical protein [Microvirga calopogonii]